MAPIPEQDPTRNLTEEADAILLPWQCTNPKCRARYAEYINGCRACYHRDGSVRSVELKRGQSHEAATFLSRLGALDVVPFGESLKLPERKGEA